MWAVTGFECERDFRKHLGTENHTPLYFSKLAKLKVQCLCKLCFFTEVLCLSYPLGLFDENHEWFWQRTGRAFSLLANVIKNCFYLISPLLI